MNTRLYCVIFVLSLFTPICLRAQDTIKPLEFSAVISADGKSQSQLFLLAKSWFIETFLLGTEIKNRVEDPTTGVFIDNITQQYLFHKKQNDFAMTMRCDGTIYYTLKIQAKDNRLKLSASSFTHVGRQYASFNGGVRFSLGKFTTADSGDSEWPKYMKECWADAKLQVTEEFERLKVSLETYLNKSNISETAW